MDSTKIVSVALVSVSLVAGLFFPGESGLTATSVAH